MSPRAVVETRRYVDGDTTVIAEVYDDGCVRFIVHPIDRSFSLGAAVLEQLATLAHKHTTVPST